MFAIVSWRNVDAEQHLSAASPTCSCQRLYPPSHDAMHYSETIWSSFNIMKDSDHTFAKLHPEDIWHKLLQGRGDDTNKTRNNPKTETFGVAWSWVKAFKVVKATLYFQPDSEAHLSAVITASISQRKDRFLQLTPLRRTQEAPQLNGHFNYRLPVCPDTPYEC